jgi:hypothetical protein
MPVPTYRRFGKTAPAGAPAADLFNIWRDDYTLTPEQAAQEEAERAASAFFDGILPPFSNVGNQFFGATPDVPTLEGKGQARDFSTANPTSAYDTKSFGKATVINKDILPSVVSGLTPDVAAKKRKLSRAKNADELRGAQLPGFSTGNAWNAATPEQLINEDSLFK